MPDSQRRRNRLSTDESYVVGALAVVAAVLGALAGCEPTRTGWFDPLLTGAVAGLVTVAGATAPWWSLATTTATLAVVEHSAWSLTVSVVAFAAALALGVRRQSAGALRALCALAVSQVALRIELERPFAGSAVIAALTMGLVLIAGISRRSRHIRRIATRVALGVGALYLFAAVCAGIAGLAARSSLSEGVRAAIDGLRAMRAGDTETASSELERSAEALASARRTIDSPLMWPGRLVPGLGQHVDSAVRLVSAGGETARVVSRTVAAVDPDSVRVRAGYVDLTAIDRLVDPIEITRDAVGDLQRAVVASRSGWLVGPFADRYRRLAEETARADLQARNAFESAVLAPQLLGRDGKRIWLVLFTNPAESRGLGGFIGSFAEIETERGQIRVVKRGSNVQLINGGDNLDGRTISGPAEYLDRYGPYGAGRNGAPMERFFWVKANMSPDLPTVARVISEIYPQSGGRKIDGVIVADPYALQSVVRLTGPLTVPGSGTVLTQGNIVRYLLVDQYRDFGTDDSIRKDALVDVADQAVSKLLTTDLPSPVVIAQAFGGVLSSGHLMIWSLRDDDTGPISRLGIGGAVPRPISDGTFFTVNNAGPNKLDSFLQQSMTYRAVVDERTGQVSADLEIRLRNTLPSPSPLPDDLIGNTRGLPPGTNRTLLTLYTPLQVVGATIDGRSQAFGTLPELGWLAHDTPVDVPPGRETVIQIRLAGTVRVSDGYSWAFRPQPLVDTTRVQVDIKFRHGARSIRWNRDIPTPLRLTSWGIVAT